MLGSLLKSVLSQPSFSLGKSSICLLELISGVIDFLSEDSIFFLQLFILVSLFRVQIIKSRLILEVDFLDLLLEVLDLSFHISLLTEKIIQVGPLLVILTLNMHVKSFNIFRLGVTSVFVKSQVIIS